MKLVYAVEKEGFNHANRVGVRKKVHSMMRFFELNGISPTLCEFVWERGFPTINIDNDTDILYFRRLEPSIKLFLKLYGLKKMKKIKIVMEIPTYPFEGEGRVLQSRIKRCSKWMGEKLLRFAIDRIVIVGSGEAIKSLYSIPVIHANNGIFFDDISVSTKEIEKGSLNLIAVSSCFFWHGYDRLIKGLEDYYKSSYKKEINFHVVGAGDCLEEYRAMAKAADLLDKHIFFYGKLEGNELDDVYDMADMAIDCLACHRKKVSYVSALKVREYAAKGLPFATANKVDVYNDVTKEYILELPADETNINIYNIVEFYEKLDSKAGNLHQMIREAFRPYCEWDIAYADVIKYLIS